MRSFLLTAAALLLCLPTNAQPFDVGTSFTAAVDSVRTGDTYVMQHPAGKAVIVELWSAYTPEIGEPWGQDARTQAHLYLNNEPVRIHVQAVDGDTIEATVKAGGQYVAPLLVRRGLALSMNEHPAADADMMAAEQEAKEDGRGIWGTSAE
jgi:endonuclease YncB( thermonuclease family)